ncbi:MAG: GNAT family N-acetyltransferase [Deltaproteobacteria bacterium]|nr:GNAT family N-acetyltransferase [Deltaproteobacteria bacterium]
MNVTWELELATEIHVQPTVEQLTDHMSEQQRQAFRDKIQRYIQKPDRDLILAVRGPEVLGLVCVIDQAELPPGLSVENMGYLKNFASGTQLLVHPSFRGRGIGSSLHIHAESWARKRGLPGYWFITHRMAHWYERDFGYVTIASIEVEGVKKIVMAKKFD